MAGHLLDALVYTDGQGFKESITTESVSIPGVPGLDPDGNDDYGDSPSTAGRLTIDDAASGELGDAGDRDWFAIELTAGNRYRFNLEGDSLVDPLLYLRNGSSSLLEYNDDKSVFSLDSEITFTAETSGTHYLDVGSYCAYGDLQPQCHPTDDSGPWFQQCRWLRACECAACLRTTAGGFAELR